jgi:hypothetical protein
MMDYSGNIVCDAAVRGQIPTLIVNELQLLTTDLADMTHDCNFHQVSTSHVVVSSVNASLSGHVRLRKAAPIDFMTFCRPVDDCLGACKEDCTIDYTAWRPHLLEPHV